MVRPIAVGETRPGSWRRPVNLTVGALSAQLVLWPSQWQALPVLGQARRSAGLIPSSALKWDDDCEVPPCQHGRLMNSQTKNLEGWHGLDAYCGY